MWCDGTLPRYAEWIKDNLKPYSQLNDYPLACHDVRMISIPNGWAQWDQAIGTYRAEKDGVVYGNYTGEIETIAQLEAVLGLEFTDGEVADLESEKTPPE